MAITRCRWNHPTTNSLLLFVCCGQKDLVQMPSSLRCAQYMVTSILLDQQYMFGVKSLFMVEKVLLMRKNLVAVWFQRPMQRSQRSIPSCSQTGVWWDKCLHEFGRYVEENISVWRLNTFACWTCSVSCLTHNAVQHLWVARKKTAGQNTALTDCVLGTSDVTVMT